MKRVMQSDDNIGRMTIEAPVALTAATERFVDQLLTRTVRVMEMAKTNTKTIQPHHLYFLNPYFLTKFLLQEISRTNGSIVALLGGGI